VLQAELFVLKLVLVAPDALLAVAFQNSFEHFPQVEVVHDHFLYPPKVINCFVAASRQLQIWEG
jgi:hypothetical protein